MRSVSPPGEYEDPALVELRMQLERVEQQLQGLQLEFSQLRVKVSKSIREEDKWSLRYSRRVVIVLNLFLGLQLLMTRFGDVVAHSARSIGAGQPRTSISKLLLTGLIAALQSSSWFFLSAALHYGSRGWQRNVATTLSIFLSCVLLATRLPSVSLNVANLNICFNIINLFARYYNLRGLQVYSSGRFL